MFALDANTVIYGLKGNGNILSRLREAGMGDVALPAVVVYELEFGTLRSAIASQRRDLHRLFGAMRILSFDQKCAEHSARVRRDLETSGTKIGPIDLLIAGTALAYDAILVTHNVREFSRVSRLQLEDWY
jgi:tRNA(fMet)-specific endonuclease VapC